IEASAPHTAAEKATQLITAVLKSVEQAKQLENTDAVIAFEIIAAQKLLSEYATSNYGSKPGQTERVTRVFWEFQKLDERWQLMESTPSGGSLFSGKCKVCFSLKEIELQGIHEFGIGSPGVWGKKGIVISQMNKM